jgi:hypothetical protein
MACERRYCISSATEHRLERGSCTRRQSAQNVVVVAMANKLARTAWAVLSSGNEYRPVAT